MRIPSGEAGREPSACRRSWERLQSLEMLAGIYLSARDRKPIWLLMEF